MSAISWEELLNLLEDLSVEYNIRAKEYYSKAEKYMYFSGLALCCDDIISAINSRNYYALLEKRAENLKQERKI